MINTKSNFLFWKKYHNFAKLRYFLDFKTIFTMSNYSSPSMEIMELLPEGILCFSSGDDSDLNMDSAPGTMPPL